MRSVWRDGDRVRTVELARLDGGRYRVTVDGAPFELTAARLPDGRLSLSTDQGVTLAELTAAGARRFVRLGNLDFVIEREASGARRAGGARGGHEAGLESPMPGVVTRVMVAAGDDVARGQPLVALEAMKMEHLIRAPRDGRVRAIPVRAGQMVDGGVPLVEMDEAGG